LSLVTTRGSDEALDENIGSAALRRTKMHHRHPASYPQGGRTSRRSLSRPAL